MTNQVTRPSADTRTRLVEAARYLFWERGYAATGLAEILRRARANSGSFYHFFDSKDALLRTVLDTYVDALEPQLMAPVRAAARRPLDEVLGLLGSYRARLLASGCTYGCPLGRLALEIDPENTPAHDRIARNFDAWKQAVADALTREGIAEPDAVATFVLTVMEGAVMQARAYRAIEPFDTCVRQLAAYLATLPRLAPRRPRRRPARKVTGR